MAEQTSGINSETKPLKQITEADSRLGAQRALRTAMEFLAPTFTRASENLTIDILERPPLANDLMPKREILKNGHLLFNHLGKMGAALLVDIGTNLGILKIASQSDNPLFIAGFLRTSTNALTYHVLRDKSLLQAETPLNQAQIRGYLTEIAAQVSLVRQGTLTKDKFYDFVTEAQRKGVPQTQIAEKTLKR